MQGYKISYPVAFDLEDEATMGKLAPKEISKLALTFCDEIRKAGYTPILYMNLNWYNNYIDWSVLEGSGLEVWIASYGDTILAPDTSKYQYTIWQRDSRGRSSRHDCYQETYQVGLGRKNVDFELRPGEIYNKDYTQMALEKAACRQAIILILRTRKMAGIPAKVRNITHGVK